MKSRSSFIQFIFLPFLLASLWGCAATEQHEQLSSREGRPSSFEIIEENGQLTEEIDTEATLSEPEITVAEEIKELETLGEWDAGKPEKVSAKAEITYDFPVTMNKQVEFYLNFFQHKHKKSFARWLERSGRYLPMMQEELRQAGLPLDLVYLPMIESGYSLTAYSRAKAVGPWQFIHSTGRHYGLTIDNFVDERRDPVKSTRAAIAFLSDLYDRFGDWHLTVAAYNAGGGKINQAIKRYKTNDFWELAQKSYLKNETKRYVPKLIAAILIAGNPGKYGFDNIDYQAPLAYETVEVPAWTSLRAVEVACGADLEDLKDLNRQLLQMMTPPDKDGYLLKVPMGRKEILAKNLPKVHATSTTNYKTHVVGKKDTLSKICTKYNLNKLTLLKANNLRKSKLTPGTRLRIPVQTTHYTLWDRDLPSSENDGSRLVLHTIKPGESISHIAQRYNVPLRLVAAWNELSDINRIRAGQQLALYVTDTAGTANIVTAKTAPHRPNTTTPVYYQVRSGDSLWSISRRFKLTATQLKKWNNLKDNLIHPGVRLRVSEPS